MVLDLQATRHSIGPHASLTPSIWHLLGRIKNVCTCHGRDYCGKRDEGTSIYGSLTCVSPLIPLHHPTQAETRIGIPSTFVKSMMT